MTQKLQGRTIDILKEYQEVQYCILDMRVERDKIEECWPFIDKQKESPQVLMFHHPYQGLFQGK